MVFRFIYVNNKAEVYGRFVNQRKEFKQKTGVDKITLTEDKNDQQYQDWFQEGDTRTAGPEH